MYVDGHQKFNSRTQMHWTVCEVIILLRGDILSRVSLLKLNRNNDWESLL